MLTMSMNIAALLLGCTGALVLLKYQAPVTLWVTKDGAGIMNWTTEPPAEEREANRRQWRRYMLRYRTGIALLALGFFFQLAAVIIR
jgi:hypothetical protein